jgi:long-chain acyl-CoA synthetase
LGTAPGLLAARARREPQSIAFRSKHLGIYDERTWGEYCNLVARCAYGFAALGLARGEAVALLGDLSEEGMICEMAAQAIGAVTWGIAPTAKDSDLECLLRDCAATVCITGDRECADRVVSLADRLPALKTLVAVDPSDLFFSTDDRRLAYEQLLLRGAERLAAAGTEGVGAVERLAAELDAAAPAFVQYPETTAGPSQRVSISHGEQLKDACALLQQYPLLASSGQRTVVYLPLSNPLGRTAAVTLPLLSGVVPHFGESSEDLVQTLFEVAPTVWFTVPHHLQLFASQILDTIEKTSAVKGRAYGLATAFGRRCVQKRSQSSASVLDEGLYRLLHWIALRPILNKLGFDQLKLIVAGGDPLSSDAAEMWQIYGLPVVGTATGNSAPSTHPN